MREYTYNTKVVYFRFIKTNTKMKAYENLEPTNNEDTFTSLLKQQTWLKDIFLNAIYLKNSLWWVHWAYYIYFYSKELNRCFINDLNFYWSIERLSVTNTIEQLTSKIIPHIISIQNRTINHKFKLPSFTYYHNRWYWSKEIVEQDVNLKPLYSEDNKVEWFVEPNWSAWNKLIPKDDKVYTVE